MIKMPDGRTLIIAEAGVNHNGDMQKAEQLILAASEAGADFVKFQTFKAKNIVSRRALKAAYQSANVNDGDVSQFEMLKALELSEKDHDVLITLCEKYGIGFFSTAFDVEGIDYLNRLGLSFFKCPSGEITNYPYLKRLGEIGKPVILSTGMANLNEIAEALKVLANHGLGRDYVTVLHCNTEYPTPMDDVNLKAMNNIANTFGVAVGYSDHTLGIEIPVAAVGLGARVIEKHFTLDRNLPGPDHMASLEPDELKAMVHAIRNVEKALSGSGIKEPSKSETKNKAVARKSIHTRRTLRKGHILTDTDLIPLRPGDGISPMEWERVIGKELRTDITENEKLTWDHIR